MKQLDDLRHCRHWIFDMDGTLTISAHDFDYIRQQLGIAPKQPILEALKLMPEHQAAPLWQRLNELELQFADQACLMPGVPELLEKLRSRGAQLAIITRNTMPVVEHTLRTCGIDQYFHPRYILDRDACAPKPSPEGILHLLELWGVEPVQSVMVGDFLFDLQAGKAAGVTTIHLDMSGTFAWPEVSDISIREFTEIEGFI